MKKDFSVAGVAMVLLLFTILSVGASVSLAQTTLSCSMSPSSVRVNETVTFTASGGSGNYFWSGSGITSTSNYTNQNTASFSYPGTYTVSVANGTQSANCLVNVVSSSSSSSGSSGSTLACVPSTQNAVVGQTINASATGGTGSYSWSSPDMTIANPNGTGFTAKYGTPGVKTLTITSGGNTATCIINVSALNVPTTPTTPTTPGLPNTGGGYGR